MARMSLKIHNVLANELKLRVERLIFLQKATLAT